MVTPGNTAELEARINELIDDRLFQAFWDAYEHFKSSDLVVCFDENSDNDPVSIFKREILINSAEIPESLRLKLSKPAKEAKFRMTASETVFWFIPMFQDGEMACVAVNAKQIGPGGNA
jgi:hypothetical protein